MKGAFMRKLMLLTVLALGTTAARAENGFFYLGAGVSYNSVKNITALYNQVDITGASWKVFAGVRPIKAFAVEADYMDLGNRQINGAVGPLTCTDTISQGLPCVSNAHAHGTAYAGYLVGFLPIPLPDLDIYAKAGAARWKLNGSTDPTPSSFSNSGTDFAWGIGGQAHFGMFGVRLEYEQFNIPNTNGAKVASLSAFLNF
jgi:opacity protein-like surface antigen